MCGAATRQLKPSFALRRPGDEPRVRFAGLPMGHEFTSLVLALLQTGGYPPKADPAAVERIRVSTGDYRFETFVSLELPKLSRRRAGVEPAWRCSILMCITP